VRALAHREQRFFQKRVFLDLRRARQRQQPPHFGKRGRYAPARSDAGGWPSPDPRRVREKRLAPLADDQGLGQTADIGHNVVTVDAQMGEGVEVMLYHTQD
jgi:hypothetical protein